MFSASLMFVSGCSVTPEKTPDEQPPVNPEADLCKYPLRVIYLTESEVEFMTEESLVDIEWNNILIEVTCGQTSD
jgi:hypothetical protein